MIVFVLMQRVPIFLLVLLLIMVYLAVIEVKDRDDMQFQVKFWWVMLVALFNFPALIALRIYTTVKNRRAAGRA
jgi:hypothetical protein